MADRLFASVALLIGFVAFSLPLLLEDTRHLWASTPASHSPAPSSPLYPPFEHEDPASAAFRRAVGEGDVGVLEEMVRDHGAEIVRKEHWHGNTPIFEAARSGKLAVVNWLIQKGASVDDPNEWGDSPINEAASMGHFDIVWRLADLGANISRTQPGGHNSLLLSAIRHRSVNALDELRRRGADLSARHWNGNTPLHEAARTGEIEMLRWFIRHGADVNATNDSGEAAIAEAAVMGHFECVSELLSAGAGVGSSESHQAAAVAMSAVRHDKIELLDLLIERGVDVVATKQHGTTPLIEAVRGDHKHVVDWLLSHGANVSEGADGESSETPLAAAAFAGHFDLMWQVGNPSCWWIT